MKIEMVLPTLELGGMEQIVVTLSAAFANDGHDVGVTCLNDLGPLTTALSSRGIPVSLVSAPGLKSTFSAPALRAHFRARRPDVVHSHSGVWGRACRAAKQAGVRAIVHTVHGRLDRDPWYDVPLKRWEARHSDAVVAVSSALEADLVGRLGLPHDRVRTLINGVDTTRFAPDEADRLRARVELGVTDRLVLGIIARLVPVKHHAALLDAVATLRGAFPSMVLLVAGDGPLEGALRAQSESLGLTSVVRFLGAVSDTPSLYRACDAFVLSSTAEGTSLSVLEAMASGCPVVATAVGGTPALLEQGALGTLASASTADSLVQALRSALDDSSMMQAKAAAARAQVEAQYSLRAMANAYEALYRSILSSKGSH